MSVYAVGVGPGSPECITGEAARIIKGCDVVAGYGYTLRTIAGLTKGKEIHEVTMASQEKTYQGIAASLDKKTLVVPFTGDASFSESEVVDRLAEIFGKIAVIPGISAVQVAAARAGIPLDKSRIITMHVSGSIVLKKDELLRALKNGQSAIVVPRPWPGEPEKHFMPSEIALWLRQEGIDTAMLRAYVYENLTTIDESVLMGTARDLEGREFSDMSVVVFDQNKPDSYANY